MAWESNGVSGVTKENYMNGIYGTGIRSREEICGLREYSAERRKTASERVDGRKAENLKNVCYNGKICLYIYIFVVYISTYLCI